MAFNCLLTLTALFKTYQAKTLENKSALLKTTSTNLHFLICDWDTFYKPWVLVFSEEKQLLFARIFSESTYSLLLLGANVTLDIWLLENNCTRTIKILIKPNAFVLHLVWFTSFLCLFLISYSGKSKTKGFKNAFGPTDEPFLSSKCRQNDTRRHSIGR